jgi:peptide/nickel transport system substrate-binding protein
VRFRVRLALNGVVLAAGVVLLALAAAEVNAARDGGTFRVALSHAEFESAIDPALAYQSNTWEFLAATCAFLMGRPDRQPPSGYRTVPEVAAGYPTVSGDGRVYTFTIRKGFRFADGAPLTARNYLAAINRLLDPVLESPGAQYADEIVGARDVLEGRARTASGITVRGDRLTIRLMQVVPDFIARLTMPFFCPVPLGLPRDPEGLDAPFSGAGPYTIASWERGRELLLVRNRFYGGERPQHVERIQIRGEDDVAAVVASVQRGEADAVLNVLPTAGRRDELIRRYGVNKSRYFIRPTLGMWYLALNTERPLFQRNARLRRAVSLAVDRRAYLQALPRGTGNATDQLVPPAMPGFRNAHVYPLKAPDLAQARALARGNTRSGKAVMYTLDTPPAITASATVRAGLAQIGLDVEIKPLAIRSLYAQISTRGAPFDIALGGWSADYPDPYSFLLLLDGRTIRDRGNLNLSYYNSARFNRQLDRANRLTGDARLRALAELEIRVLRDDAPVVALYNINANVFVSERAGCLLFNGRGDALNLGAVCLK